MSESYYSKGEIHRARSYEKVSMKLKSFVGPINRVSQLYNIEGFSNGSTIFEVMKEIIETGKSTLLEGRKNDPTETSVKLLKTVWGIGKVTADKLVKVNGIKTVDQLRKAVEVGMITLEPGQLIGLNRYDDFNLRIPREEVEEINQIVMEYAEKIVPGVQGTVCGSYRRGKSDCGDVDILFVPPTGKETMKKTFLAELVEKLDEGISIYKASIL